MKPDLITHYRTQHELALKTYLEDADIPALRIRDAIHYVLFPAGKRLRPLLVYLCGDLLGVSAQCLDVIAVAIELTHNYSLIHDDLPAMDDDDFRRGKLSCHRAFDEATAILAGDGMQALAFEILLRYLPQYCSNERVIMIARELVRTTGPSGMVSGQSLDLTMLSQPSLTIDELKMIHQLKTGKLISACIDCVIHASQASAEASQALRDYAKQLGLVFQMQDDYLDAYAAPECLGKNRHSDASNEKITFASLYSQAALQSLIQEHYQLAKQALNPFQEKAEALLTLTQALALRGEEQKAL